MTQVSIEAMGGAVPAKKVPKGQSAPIAKPVIGIVHRTLRSATRNDHASIDRMLLRFDLNRADDYRIFLNIHFTSLVALRADWRLQDGEDFAHMLGCLQADLETLGCKTPALPMLSPRPTNPAKALGVGYVVRGSRLGAAALRRGVVGELPTSYLDFIPRLSWAGFLMQLEFIADDPNGRNEATRAAISTFNTFATEFKRFQDSTSIPPPQ
jgi:heme oxygenase